MRGDRIEPSAAARPLVTAMARGAACRCPACGEGRVFAGYLRVATACDACGLRLDGHRADDLPPYVTILLAGKTSVALLVTLDQAAVWSQAGLTAVVGSVALGLCLALIRPVKGAVIGIQWANAMHGFAPDGEDPHSAPSKP